MSTLTLPEEAARRRTFAIIAHPDAGKTTLTEQLLLLGGAILTLVVTVRLALPVIAEEDRAALRIPRNFEQLKALNDALQHYSHTHFFRVMIAWTAIFLLYAPHT